MTNTGITYRTAATDAESRYAVRHWEGQAIVERWFPTRDDRTAYLISIGCPQVLTWEDPVDDTNMTNIYTKGKAI